ncbi:MAG: RnfH family protein [Methylococcales bacterium]|nr:RnfH family protein [Methylococcales bacterium]
MQVEVAYARPDEQVILALTMPAPATAEQVIEKSGVLKRFPEIDLTVNKVGVFGVVCALDKVLATGDRVEIYRPLISDPKATRRKRAAKQADEATNAGAG